MIGSLRGSLLDRAGDGEVIIEVGGIGYRITMMPAAIPLLGELGAEVFAWVHHHIREDAQTLYGFTNRDERVAFEALIGAHGVGPALALAILSVHEPVALARVLAEDDVAALCLVPGVGKKTAARLMVELKNRLDVLPAIDLTDGGGSASAVAPEDSTSTADVRDALTGLGYGVEEIHLVLRDLPADADSSALLRQALQRLAAV
ncbi:MAG: Holliday junction branch migration protein RuvA [Actinomycetia bacterium]|nr:Holliday junction branch migration protein RuvA [Actinomycetes bacterium]MCP3911755.1 Holliday junction branch migration protein RuvA [Actinomycetes bacterium]